MKLVRFYEMTEGSTENMWYQIVITCGNEKTEILKPTMREAYSALEQAGYKIFREEGGKAIVSDIPRVG